CGSSFYRCGVGPGLGDLSRLGLSCAALSGTTGAVGASCASCEARTNSDGIANSGSGESGIDCACDGRIPLASTIDHRQSSSGPGVIPIFSRNAVVLKGLAAALK